MKIDFKNPISFSLFSIVVTFLICMIVLCVTKPSYIIYVSAKGKKKKNIYLLFTYSMLFAVVIETFVLLWKTGLENPIKTSPILSFNSKAYRP